MSPRTRSPRRTRPSPVYGACKGGCAGVRRLSHTGYCRVCFEMGSAPVATPREPWIGAALNSPVAVRRLETIGADIARERDALGRLAFRQAAHRDAERAMEAEMRARMAEVDEIDPMELASHAPRLARELARWREDT
jgi:hypothetical protein